MPRAGDAKSIYLVESALELPRFQCPPCPARNDKCPALAPLKECLPGNPAATDCVGHECEFGCKPMVALCVETTRLGSMRWDSLVYFRTASP